jgi:hypothetical protein
VTALVKLPSIICVIITSRPDDDIVDAFFDLDGVIHTEELEVSSDNKDIENFICKELKTIRKNKVPKGWPDESKISKLVQLLKGLFIWAATACKQIHGYKPAQVLEDLINSPASVLLKDLYKVALEASCGCNQSELTFRKEYPAILGLILAVKDPLSPKAIDCFLKDDNVESYGLISQLGSVLLNHHEDGPVCMLYDSFQDYLLSKSGLDSPWYITIADHNQKLAEHSIQLLDHTFGDEFCCQNLDQPRRREGLDEVMIYAASYWITHVREIDICPKGFQEQLLQWLRKHCLHWLQALSMLEISRHAAGWLKQLMAWMQVSLDHTAIIVEAKHQ